MNEKYKFTIDKLVSIKEIIKNIEETNYIDGYLGYEDDFYIDSILYYLKENARLKDKIEKAIEYMERELGYLQKDGFKAFGDLDYAQEEIEELYKILKGGD